MSQNRVGKWLTALVDLKIVSILSVIAGGLFVWEIWEWYTEMMDNLLIEGRELPPGWDVALLGLLGVALGSFWKSVGHIQKNYKSDEQNDD